MSEDTPSIESYKQQIPHYHGDTVRVLFVVASGLMFLAELIDGRLPFTSGAMILMIILLVVAAGITNPIQVWIHWVNLSFSLVGLMLFGGAALNRFRSDAPFTESLLMGTLAAIFLVSLYLATRTVRGLMLHSVRASR